MERLNGKTRDTGKGRESLKRKVCEETNHSNNRLCVKRKAKEVVGMSVLERESAILKKIRKVLPTDCTNLCQHPFILNLSKESLQHNHKIFKKAHYNYKQIIDNSDRNKHIHSRL